MEKIQIFDQSHGVTLLKKYQIFDFRVYKSFFPFLEYCQTHFPVYFGKNKNMEKFQIFDQNHGLTLVEKSRFFDFFNFPFFIV